MTHRLVLFEKIGYGPHRCHWCGDPIDWREGIAEHMVVADHVDGDQQNNDPDNIVPSCFGCNVTRDRRVADDELYVVKQGKRHRAVRRTCENCSAEFLVSASAVRRSTKNVGRFCSMECLWSGR